MGLFRTNPAKTLRKAKRRGIDVTGAVFADDDYIPRGDFKGGRAYLICYPDRIEIHRFGPPAALFRKRDTAIVLRDKVSSVTYREEKVYGVVSIAASNAEAEFWTDLRRGPRLRDRLQRWAAGVPV